MELGPKRLERGYSPQFDTEVQRELIRLTDTSTQISVTWALIYVLSIPTIACCASIWINLLGIIDSIASVLQAFVVYSIAIVFIARQQRGLENMVHDASHGSWCPLHRSLNNRLANLLVAYPVFSKIESYWRFHRAHHGGYGGYLDPCRQRFQNMGLGHLDLSTRGKIVRAVIRWLPAYVAQYYREIGSSSSAVWRNFVVWHVGVFIVPAAIILCTIFGVPRQAALIQACAGWIAFWLVPSVLALPVIRSIAEAEEHDYENGDTEFATTFTNIGWVHLVLLHPFNDAYHLVHHMFPSIPAVNCGQVHRLLMKHDASYPRALRRNKVLRG